MYFFVYIFNYYYFFNLNSLSIRREQISMEKKTQGMALLFYLIQTRFRDLGRNPKKFKFDIFPLVVIHSYVSQPLLVFHVFVIALFTCVLTPSAGGCPTPAQLHYLLSMTPRWSLIASGYFHFSSLCAHVKKMFKKNTLKPPPYVYMFGCLNDSYCQKFCSSDMLQCNPTGQLLLSRCRKI